jgi:hypothetical protein
MASVLGCQACEAGLVRHVWGTQGRLLPARQASHQARPERAAAGASGTSTPTRPQAPGQQQQQQPSQAGPVWQAAAVTSRLAAGVGGGARGSRSPSVASAVHAGGIAAAAAPALAGVEAAPAARSSGEGSVVEELEEEWE